MLTLHLKERLMKGEVFQLQQIRSDVNRLVGEHRHDYAEIFWLLDGRCQHRLNGKEERLAPGTVHLLRPTDCHRLQSVANERFTFANLIFDAGYWENLRDRHPQPFARLFDLKSSAPSTITLSWADFEELKRQVDQLLGGPADAFHLEWFLFVLAQLTAGRSATACLLSAPLWLREACVRITEPEWFAQGVAGFVKAAGHGHEYVCRSTQLHLGKTPSQLVNEMRMRYACRVLMTTDRKITEIAVDCGFTTTTQFYDLFRRFTGLTPLRYRRRCQKAI